MQVVFARPTPHEEVREKSVPNVLQERKEVPEGGSRDAKLISGHIILQNELLAPGI